MNSKMNAKPNSDLSVKSILTLQALDFKALSRSKLGIFGGPTKFLNLLHSEKLDATAIKEFFVYPKKLTKDNIKKAVKSAEDTLRFFRIEGEVAGGLDQKELGRLERALSPPMVVFVRGNSKLLKRKPVVSIVGSRLCSKTGENRAYKIAKQLSELGVLIVSGGAVGIDLAAHQGALVSNAETLVVLATPINIKRDDTPLRIKKLHPQNRVTTLNVFGPWVPYSNSLFVIRNQYIAAMADALVIIEGKADSGTLHTARFAQKMNIPIWAVPGDPDNTLAGAANLLLEEGSARALISPESLQKSLGIKVSKPKKAANSLAKKTINHISSHHDRMMNLFIKQNGRLTVDFLCEELNMPIHTLQSELLTLELAGQVRKEGPEFVLLKN